MKLVRFEEGSKARVGVVVKDHVIDIHQLDLTALETVAPGDMQALLALGQEVLEVLEGVCDVALAQGKGIALEDVRYLAPIANPPKIICAWVNYPNPLVNSMPEVPIFFSKYTSAITGPNDSIELPSIGSDIVVEPELAIVIGKGGRHISEEDAFSHVAGYTIANDVTAFSHRLQILLGAQGPYMMAKSFDTFCPLGPWLVTSDELADPTALTVNQYQNGELCTTAHTSNMVYKMPKLISYISDFFTLQPGDIILTGSPPPIGGKPKFLKAGDHIRIEIEGLDAQECTVVSEG